jgi:hypothetical protein
MMPYFMPSLSGKHPVQHIIHLDDFCHADMLLVVTVWHRSYDLVFSHVHLEGTTRRTTMISGENQESGLIYALGKGRQ